MQIIPLSQGTFTIGHDKIFKPFNENTDELNKRPTGSLLVEIQPFIVVTGTDVLLFDCGLLLDNNSGKPALTHSLSSAGFNTNDITKIFFSHLHKDHSGGAVFRDQNGELQLTFPHIPHFIYKPEMEEALANKTRSYDQEVIAFINENARINWLTGEQGEEESIHFEHSGGHSPQHIVFSVFEDGETAFFGGDEAPQLRQMKIKYVAKYDFDGKKAMELREEYARMGKEKGWKFLFYHDIKHPIAQL